MSTLLLSFTAFALSFSSGYISALYMAHRRRKVDAAWMRERLRDAKNDGWRAGHRAALSGLTTDTANRKAFATNFESN